MSGMLNPLAKAKGHGSAKQGVHHWLAQRMTAGILLILIPWLIYSIVQLAGASHAEAALFVGMPLNATLLTLVLATVLYHTALGLQVVIEDYVHHHALEFLLHFLVRFAALAALITGVIHILKTTLGN